MRYLYIFIVLILSCLNVAFCESSQDNGFDKTVADDVGDLVELPKGYFNINNSDDMTKQDFKPMPYINVNGGWGMQSGAIHGGGTFLASLGYRFTKAYALEFGYQTFVVSAYNTTQVNNFFSVAPKFYYEINEYVTAAVATAVGLSVSNVNNIANAQNAPQSWLNTNHQWSGFVAFPAGLMFPIKSVDNLSLKMDYVYALGFNKSSSNFVTSGLQYAF